MTEMMKTYADAKAKMPGMLLLFRIGDFYEMFGSDAENARAVLGLTITTRTWKGEQMSMAGFPHHQLERYLRKLITIGVRVAICEQVA